MYMKILDSIAQHPYVSRAIEKPEFRTGGAMALVRFRLALRDYKRARRNSREEIHLGGKPADAWDKGMICQLPPLPGKRLLKQALEAGGIPEDLERLITQALQ